MQLDITIGTLCIHTSTSLEDTLWLKAKQQFVVDKGKQWADIISRILK